jgi:hypothetical protein
MKREYPSTPEEAFEASIRGAYYAVQMAKVREQKRICRVPHETGLPVNVAWDLGMDDQTVLIFHQQVGPENRIFDYYENNGEALSHYVQVMQGKPYIYGEQYLPHDVAVRELGTGKSRLEQLEALGVKNIHVVQRELSMTEEHGIDAVRAMLGSCWFDEQNCDPLISALDAYQKEWDDKIGGFRQRPLHNWASHPADAMRMLCLGHSPKRIIKGKKSNRRRDARVI